MTTYYVGIGGNNGNNGTTWALRKETLNGAEDIPVAAADVVYVGPGVYRETLTVDVSGSSGSPITYIGDVTGEHTDGVGGIVRITGSDNDQATSRSAAISATSKDYRTFRGFCVDGCSSHAITLITACSNFIIEDIFGSGSTSSGSLISIAGTGTGNTVRRCVLFATGQYMINIAHSSTVDNAGHLIENVLCLGSGNSRLINVDRVGGVTIKNCTVIGGDRGISIGVALADGQVIEVYNCIIAGNQTGLYSASAGDITEDYNTLYSNGTDRTNTSTGGNSVAYMPLFNMPILLDGFRFPWFPAELSKWSQVARIAGTSESTDDLFGMTRSVTSAKKSWGAIQATGAVRETTTVDASSAASIKLPDAGEQFLMRVPITAISTTIAIECYREADYAGTNPQMIIRQPGQSDRTTTDAGSASAWNTLTDTFTPAALPPYVDVFIKSSNTATSGNYDAFFDTLTVS